MTDDLKINIRELEVIKKRNFEERLRFIEFYAKYIKKRMIVREIEE